MNWFRSNDIEQHASQKTRTGDAAVDDPANALLLGEDLHCTFDKLQFVFIPEANGVLVTHVLESTIELRNLYHNTSLHQFGVDPQLFFCSFRTDSSPLSWGLSSTRSTPIAEICYQAREAMGQG